MSEPCPFCGSKEIKVKTPYIDQVTLEPLETFCCKSQKTNSKYITKRFDPTNGEAPTPEEVTKI